MMTHADIQADLPLFALGSLDLSERREIEQHLESCDVCQRELAGWRDVVALIPLGVDDAEPSNLKARLLQTVHRPELPAARPPARVIPLRRWVAVPLAAAAVALLAFALVRNARLGADLEQQRQIVASLRADLDASEGRLEQVKQVLAEKERDVGALRLALRAAQDSLSVLQTRGLTLVRLQQTPDAKPAEAHMIVGHDAGRALFYAFDLPPVEPNKTYELWWITEKEGPVNAGLFVPGADGLGRIETAVPRNAGAIKAAAVTIEPAGGVVKPTGPMVLLGNVERIS